MPDYRRAYVPGGTYFFTVNTYGRGAFLLDESVRRALREGIRLARDELPFLIEAWVLLPDHLHCIWTLRPGDADFSKRDHQTYGEQTLWGQNRTGGADERIAPAAQRGSDLAAKILGTSVPRGARFFDPYGLHPLQPGKT